MRFAQRSYDILLATSGDVGDAGNHAGRDGKVPPRISDHFGGRRTDADVREFGVGTTTL